MPWRRQSANISKGTTGNKLAKAIGEYLASEKAEEIIRNVFKQAEQSEDSPNLTPRARTAGGWLNNMGLHYGRIGKGVYVDGHEREDVRQYRQDEFV